MDVSKHSLKLEQLGQWEGGPPGLYLGGWELNAFPLPLGRETGVSIGNFKKCYSWLHLKIIFSDSEANFHTTLLPWKTKKKRWCVYLCFSNVVCSLWKLILFVVVVIYCCFFGSRLLGPEGL
jgi:hypothetical protein